MASKSIDRLALRVATSLYRALLRGYPQAFRASEAQDMEYAFRYGWRQSESRLGFALRELTNLATNVMPEQMDQYRGAGRTAPASSNRFEPSPDRNAMLTAALIDDFRQALRTLRRSLRFNATVVGVLALGIGASASVFGLVDVLLLSPPSDLTAPERILAVYQSSASNEFGALSYPDIVDLRDSTNAFEAFSARVRLSMSFGNGGETSPIVGEVVSPGYFRVLGTSPALGRAFTAVEEGPDAPAVAILGDALWQRTFAADPRILGRTVSLNGRPHSIVGVAGPGFRAGRIDEPPEIWVPSGQVGHFMPQFGPEVLQRRHWRAFEAVGRLAEGVSVEAARDSLAIQAARLEELDPSRQTPRQFTVLPVQQAAFSPAQRGAVVRFATIVMGVVGLILLVACLNIANIMLVRGALRSREIAVRKAMGAGRSRIARQLLAENLLLATLGGLGGLLVFQFASPLLLRLEVPAGIEIAPQLSVRVLAVTAGLVLLVGMVFGLAPALRGAKTSLRDELTVDAGGRASRGGTALKRLYVVAQVAACTVLLVTAGLLLRTVTNLSAVDIGFQFDHAITVTINPEDLDFDEARGRQLFDELMPRLRALPGVRVASFTSDLPLGPEGSRMGLFLEGHGEEVYTDVKQSIVAPDYFRAIGIQLLAGRDFRPGDEQGRARNAIVNQAFADRFWPGEEPLGKGISVGGPSGPFYEVIGVVGDHRHSGLDQEPAPHLFWAFGQIYAMMSGASKALVVRTDREPLDVLPLVRAEITALEPDLPVREATTLEEHYRGSMSQQRQSARLLSALGALGLLLAAAGIYGVTSFLTMTRAREIGIRIALGATPDSVLQAVVVDGLKAALVGVVVGTAASLAVSRLVASMLFGLSPTDAATYLTAAAIMLAVAALGAAYPAWRASRTDPSETLRLD